MNQNFLCSVPFLLACQLSYTLTDCVCFLTTLSRYEFVLLLFPPLGEFLWRFFFFWSPAASFSCRFVCLSTLSLSLWCTLVPFRQCEFLRTSRSFFIFPLPALRPSLHSHARDEWGWPVAFHYVVPLPTAKLQTNFIAVVANGSLQHAIIFLSLISFMFYAIKCQQKYNSQIVQRCFRQRPQLIWKTLLNNPGKKNVFLK